MNDPLDVAAIVGSLRRESYTRRLAEALARLAGSSMRIEIVEIRDLPFYNQDDEEFPPPPWVAFRARIKRADGVLFATPEYNRSIPACLKNAIDVGSRPYTSNAWAGKPAAVISASPGVLGGLWSKPSSAAVPGGDQCADDAGARGLHRRQQQPVRCRWRIREYNDSRPVREVCQVVRGLDQASPPPAGRGSPRGCLGLPHVGAVLPLAKAGARIVLTTT